MAGALEEFRIGPFGLDYGIHAEFASCAFIVFFLRGSDEASAAAVRLLSFVAICIF
jgi:hypothetical protein